MSTSAVPPKASESQRPAHTQPTQGKTQGEKPAASGDLFASLLGLMSDAQLAPAEAPTLEGTAAQDGAADDAADNPTAALLAWSTPADAAPQPAEQGTGFFPTARARDTAAPATDADQATGLDIEGMTLVDDSAAGLPGADGDPARPAFSTPPSRPAGAARGPAQAAPAMNWQRATAVSSTDALQQQHAAQAARTAAPQGPQMIPVRSTVALDERFGLSGAGHITGTGTPLTLAASARETGVADPVLSQPAGGGGMRLGADAPLGIAGAASGSASDTPGDDTQPGGDQAQRGESGTAEGEEGPTVTHWGTQHLRHASLRVGGEGSADAIGIQLSMKGQEVQVAFQSDNPDARASLREGAGEALADLLQRSGIQLGGVSVGAHGQSQGDAGAHHTPTASRGQAHGRDESPARAPAATQPAARADGSRPLDLFV